VVEAVVEQVDGLAEDVVRVAAAVDDPVERLQRAAALCRGAPVPASKAATRSRKRSGTTTGRRCSRSTRTSVCLAVTISRSSSTR
jgi:hypothetical protein